MSRRLVLLVTCLVADLGLCAGCRPTPTPSEEFAEGERLRTHYEEAASRDAIERYEAARTGWLRIGNTQRAAAAGQRVGVTYRQLGLLKESTGAYAAALELASASGDRLFESEVRSDLGALLASVADRNEAFEEARAQCQLALEAAHHAGAPSEEAKALVCLGETAYYNQGLEEALSFYERAGAIREQLRDGRGLAQTLLYQGDVHSDLSRFEEARRCYDRARSLWSSTEDSRNRAILLVSTGRLAARLGDYQNALNDLHRALAVVEPAGDAVWEGSALTGLARVYLDMGEVTTALRYWERSLELFETAGLNHISIDVLNSLGQTYLASGDDATALSRFDRALALAEEHELPRFSARALDFIGVVFLLRQLPDRARETLERSLDIQLSPESPDDPRLQARTLVDLGEAYELLGDHQHAVEHLAEGLSLGMAAADRVSEARALFGLARASLSRNDFEAARTYVERSLEVAESLRTAVESRDLRASYSASVYRYHEFHMDLLMQLATLHPGERLAAAAFEASEHARARSLLESLAEAEVDLRAGVSSDLLKREALAKRALDECAFARAVAPSPDQAATMDQEYEVLEERYDQLEAEIRSESPRYAALAKPQPLSLAEVQEQILDADTLLLEYALGDERSYLWAVSAAGQSSFTLPPRAAIEEAAERLYALLTARLTATGDLADRQRRGAEADAEYWTEAAGLSDMLLGPVASILADKRILVVADGALQYLPFAALPIPGRPDGPVPMVVEHEIVHLPSASVLAVVRRETGDRPLPAHSVAVLADPVFEPDDPRLQNGTANASQQGRPSGVLAFLRDGQAGVPPRLAATRREARAILARAPDGKAWTGFDASRATALSPDLAEYRIVHFATHGVFDNENPGLSGVLLSMFDAQGEPQDGFLRLRDIYGLRLPAELVVLSACNTALGKQVRGEGLVGIVRGFMYAGAKRVVASLWKVDDEATRELMTHFYRHMFDDQRSPASALREAQVEMWQQDRWRSPFYWAAFVLQGEWR